MVTSRHTSAHVHSVFEVNFSKVARVREAKKNEYEHAGAKLTYLSFIIKAAVDALRAVPVVNAPVDGDFDRCITRDVNVGIAVALDWGLIVPVIKHADEKNLLRIEPRRVGSGHACAEQTAQARRGERRNLYHYEPWCIRRALRHADHQPAAGRHSRNRRRSRKRPVVVDDAIAIRLHGAPVARLRSTGSSTAPSPTNSSSNIKHALENWTVD